MSFEVFTYGSLEVAEIMTLISGTSPPSRAASLEGYRRRVLVGERYPGIIRDPDESTHGTLYSGIDEAALSRLDEFESDYYRRETVSVRCGSGERVSAFAYVIASDQGYRLSREVWDIEAFRRIHYVPFLAMCRRFVADTFGDEPDVHGNERYERNGRNH